VGAALRSTRILGRVTNRDVLPSLTFTRQAAGLLAGLALGVALLAGCSSEGASTDCEQNTCTVTFDRGANASASMQGFEAKLIGVQGDQVTVTVAGEQFSLAPGQPATEAGGFSVTLDSLTDEQVVIRVVHDITTDKHAPDTESA
jgi:hypothetical protein